MCDFHSICVRATDGAIAHIATNSHSGAVAAANWRENQPHRQKFFFEAEWEGEGPLPPLLQIIRHEPGDEVPKIVLDVVCKHYTNLAELLKAPSLKHLRYFSKPEYSDVRLKVATRPNTPVDMLVAMKDDAAWNVRKAVAANPNTPVEVLVAMKDDAAWNVRNAVAANPNTPVEVLVAMKDDAAWNVRKAVAANPNMPR